MPNAGIIVHIPQTAAHAYLQACTRMHGAHTAAAPAGSPRWWSLLGDCQDAVLWARGIPAWMPRVRLFIQVMLLHKTT